MTSRSQQTFIESSLSYALPQSLEGNYPLDYATWKDVHGLQESELYYKYVKAWFDEKRKINNTFTLKDRYKSLIDHLRILYGTEDAESWYAQVDTSSDKELLAAIPFFAQKLREISNYYFNLRARVAGQRNYVSQKGSTKQVVARATETLLREFTQNSAKQFASGINATLPQFSALEDFSVDVVELYDETAYLGAKDTANFELSANEAYYLSQGLDLDTAEAVYFALTESTLEEASPSTDYSLFVAKYLGADRIENAVEAAEATTQRLVTWNIEEGKNSFYYATGNTQPSDSSDGILPSMPLSSMPFDEATAGNTLSASDILAISYGDTIEAAWRLDGATEPFSINVSVDLEAGQTTFLFPFPGFGLSASDVGWTGPSLSSTPEYPFLGKAQKQAIQDAYWSNVVDLTSVAPININQSNIVNSGAKAGTHPLASDSITVGERSAWLARFDTTQIPIVEEETVVTWPYNTEADEASFPANFVEVCSPVSVQSFNKKRFVAGTTPASSDCILRLDPNSGNVLAAVWLSGNETTNTTNGTKMVSQAGFNGLFASGQATSFVWTGPDNSSVDAVFSYRAHGNFCPFKDSTNADDFASCNCGQTFFSPFGHTSRTYDDAGIHADFIAESNSSLPTSIMDLNAWRSESEAFRDSNKVVWFQTKIKNGWEDGTWKAADGSGSLVLRTGKRYWYGRAGSRKEQQQYPPLVCYYDSSATVEAGVRWVDGYVVNNEVISTGNVSEMYLYPGDRLLFKHRDVITHYLLSSEQVKNTDTNVGSIWSTLDRVVVNGAKTSPVTFSWPTIDYNLAESNANDPYEQYPSTRYAELTAVVLWSVTSPSLSTTFLSGEWATYTPATTGLHTVSVTAEKIGGAVVVFDSIPPLTAVGPTRQETIFVQVDTPAPSFVLEVPLVGWDPNTNTFAQNLSSTSGKPFWAEIFDEQTEQVGYAALPFTGRSQKLINGYVPDTQPKLSNLQIVANEKITYNRVGDAFTWKQSATMFDAANPDKWKKIEIDTETTHPSFPQLSSLFVGTKATNYDSDMTLSNFKQGQPVIVHYWANDSLTVDLSADTVYSEATYVPALTTEALRPWNIIPNRYGAFVATIPNPAGTYTLDDYDFLSNPDSLGLTTLIGPYKFGSITSDGKTVSPTVTIGGQGNTDEVQPSLFAFEENSMWMKEPAVASNIAGNPKKDLTNKHQTFVGYESSKHETGFVTSTSLLDPWEGDEWIDENNKPVGFTGVVNVSAWGASQILKNQDKRLYQWQTDMFGNQYGLFKPLSAELFAEAAEIDGALWVRTENNVVKPIETSTLSATFEHYIDVPQLSSLWVQVKDGYVKNIEVVWDTLWVELSSHILVEKLDYSYEDGTFDTQENTSRQISLYPNDQKGIVRELAGATLSAAPAEVSNIVANSLLKTSLLATAYLSAGSLHCGLYLYKHNEVKLTKVVDEFLDLDGFTINQIFNTKLASTKFGKHVIGISGIDNSSRPFVMDVNISQKQDKFDIYEVNLYASAYEAMLSANAPLISAEALASVLVVSADELFSYYLPVVDSTEEITWELLSPLDQGLTVESPGVVYGVLEAGLYYVNIQLSNIHGTTTHCLTISAA